MDNYDVITNQPVVIDNVSINNDNFMISVKLNYQKFIIVVSVGLDLHNRKR